MYKTPLYRRIMMFMRGQSTTESLIKNGMKVGTNFSRRNNVQIDASHAYMIDIGNNVTMAGGGKSSFTRCKYKNVFRLYKNS